MERQQPAWAPYGFVPFPGPGPGPGPGIVMGPGQQGLVPVPVPMPGSGQMQGLMGQQGAEQGRVPVLLPG